jgi:hypothetical protein
MTDITGESGMTWEQAAEAAEKIFGGTLDSGEYNDGGCDWHGRLWSDTCAELGYDRTRTVTFTARSA